MTKDLEDIAVVLASHDERITDLEKTIRVLGDVVLRQAKEIEFLISKPNDLTNKQVLSAVKRARTLREADRPEAPPVIHGEGYETISYARPSVHLNGDGDTDFGDFDHLNEPY